jgi:ATP-dependent Lon protease
MPRILKDLKMEADQIALTDAALEKVITAHTREAGVRSLKRKLEALARKAVRNLMEELENSGGEEPAASGEAAVGTEGAATVPEFAPAGENIVSISPEIVSDLDPGARPAEGHARSASVQLKRLRYDVEDVRHLLGRDRFHHDLREDTGIPGVATGLAWTPVGGDILFIEAMSYPGKGDLKLSGQLGDVMKESALAALSFLRSHSAELGIDSDRIGKQDIHIHVPSGAIPKDGPSAGVTMLSALASLFTGEPINDTVAMTGEISLRGRVLPVGGIKEKILAAKAAGIDTVLLPEKNRAEYEEIAGHVREGLHVEYFSDMMQLLRRTVPGAFDGRRSGGDISAAVAAEIAAREAGSAEPRQGW